MSCKRGTGSFWVACTAIFALTGCFGLDEGPEDAAGEDSDREVPDPSGDSRDEYIARANAGLDVWGIGLPISRFASGRSVDSSSTYNPANWITVAGKECEASGMPEGLRGACPFLADGVIGFCSVRAYRESGIIVDTTLVARDTYQNGDAPVGEKFAVFSHEVGHCLGLKHTETTEHLMYFTTSGANEPSAPELFAMAETYLPPSIPSTETWGAFFSSVLDADGTARPKRHSTVPVIYLDADMGVVAESFTAERPMPGPRLRGPVETTVHLFRDDGSCETVRLD